MQPTEFVESPIHGDLRAAAVRVGSHIRRTPVLELSGDELGLDARTRVVLKLELLQHTGSFKARGALNALLCGPIPAGGVVGASGGNHGAALAWAARRAGVPARIFVPATSPPLKAERVRSHGAEVVIVEGYYPEALAASRAWAAGIPADRPVLEVHAYDTPAVVAGQGTLGLELAAQVPTASAVLVSCGGGGLFAGVALALADQCEVLPVEPERCPSLAAAVEAGGPVRTEVGGVAADSMGAAYAGRIAHAVASAHGVRPVLVEDAAITAARAFLWDHFRVLAEPGGATAFAGLLSGAFTPAPGATVVVVVSGGNAADLPAVAGGEKA